MAVYAVPITNYLSTASNYQAIPGYTVEVNFIKYFL
jgi:hypothetical protein